MIEIRSNCLYTRQDLVEMLGPSGVDADFFIARLHPVKRFKMLYYGADLLKALDQCPPLAERDETANMPRAKNRGNRQKRGKIAVDDPLEPLNRLLR